MPTRRTTDPHLIGRASKAKGEVFEHMIIAACREYAEQGRALIEKTPEPMKPLRRLSGGQFVACFEKKAQPDFKGALAGGRTIAFEAKCTDSGQINQTAVTDEQARELATLDRLGATCFVLVSYSFELFARVPWRVWHNMKPIYGRKYLKASEAEEFRVPFNGMYVDFLSGME